MSTSESWPFPSAHVVACFWQQPFKKWSKISQLCPSLIIIYEKCPIEVLAAKWDCKITFKSLFTFSSLHCEWFLSGRHEKVKSVCVLLVWSGWAFFRYIFGTWWWRSDHTLRVNTAKNPGVSTTVHKLSPPNYRYEPSTMRLPFCTTENYAALKCSSDTKREGK